MSDLIDRAKAGEEDAVAELIEQFEVRVRLYAAMVAPRPDMAEDVAQKAFVVALNRIQAFNSTGNFGLWMQGIVRNVARQEWERIASRSKFERDGLAEFLDALAGSATPPKSGDLSEHRLDALRSCLERLSGRAREIVNLSYGMDLSCKDISARIGTSADAVKMALVRIRGSLRQCVQTQMVEENHGL